MFYLAEHYSRQPRNMVKTELLKWFQETHSKESTQLLNITIQSQYSLERRPEKEKKRDSTRYQDKGVFCIPLDAMICFVGTEMLTKNTTYTKV